MRTWPEPSILPSIVSPAASSDSFASPRGALGTAAACRADSMLTGVAAAAGLSGAGSGVFCSRPYWSFHNAMTSLLN
jgi:hypothetical protein